MKSLSELQAIKDRVRATVLPSENDGKTRVVVGMATCGIAAGATPVLDALKKAVDNGEVDDVLVEQTGCVGICQYEPVVEVFEPGKDKVTYVKMDAEKTGRVIEEHLKGGKVVEDFLLSDANGEKTALKDTAFYKPQQRVVLRNCGLIDPESIDEYIAMDGYAALGKVLTSMSPEDVIEEVKKS
ncbi:MAG TPA: NADH-quinone oxidoreductase subunit F, partial [Ruminococcaceae bacterium]|nr:NADH-quinone oxidoreductase subunit F [Oscillospiraceae bacterium]